MRIQLSAVVVTILAHAAAACVGATAAAGIADHGEENHSTPAPSRGHRDVLMPHHQTWGSRIDGSGANDPRDIAAILVGLAAGLKLQAPASGINRGTVHDLLEQRQSITKWKSTAHAGVDLSGSVVPDSAKAGNEAQLLEQTLLE